MDKSYNSYNQLHGHCLEIIKQLSSTNWRPDLIVGLTRGGLLPANLISQFLNIPMVSLNVSLRDSSHPPESNEMLITAAKQGKRILIIDDINDTGATINWIMEDWGDKEGHTMWGGNVRFAVIVNNEASGANHYPDYIGTFINKHNKDVWVVFPWEEFWRTP